MAQSAGGATDSSILSFTTSATPATPVATTQAATNLTGATATLNASVNAEGNDTTVSFVYGTYPQLAAGNTTTTAQDIGSGTSAVAVNAAVTGLQPDTTYYVEVVATNSAGTTDGPIITFTTPNVPSTTTQAATGITGTAATLNGSVNPEGIATSVSFVYGTNPQLASGTTTTAAQSIGSGTSAVAVNAALTGLQPGTTYYYEVVANSAGGTTDGSILSFITPAPPVPTTQAATDVTDTGARLNGNVNPEGSPTTINFVYSTDSTLTNGTSSTPAQVIGGVGAALPVTAVLSGLQPSTIYYEELVATNAGGTSVGTPILSFTTPAAPAQAPTITTNPTNQTVNAGQTATFTAAASGNPTPTCSGR